MSTVIQLKKQKITKQIRASITRVFANNMYSFPMFQIKCLLFRMDHRDTCDTYYYRKKCFVLIVPGTSEKGKKYFHGSHGRFSIS